MKKLLLISLYLGLFLSLNAVTKVAYVTKSKSMDGTATAQDNDPVIQMLKADANYEVTVFLSDGASAIDGLANYDVIVIQESFGSGDAILKPTGSLALSTLPKPFLYNKMYSLRSGKALTSGSGASAESPALSIAVETTALTNPLFAGCTMSGNLITVLNGTYSDTGAAGTKALNYNTGNVISVAGTLLAQPSDVTTAVFFINDVPAGTTIDSEITKSRMITLGMNYGALCANGGTNITADGLKIYKNAIDILKATSTGVVNPEVTLQVISTDYFTVNGQIVKEPIKGIYLKRVTYENGATKLDKIVLTEDFAR